LHLRNAATLTWVERECFLESAEQAGLWRCSTIWQQERGSRWGFLFQLRQYLLNDDGILNAGNYLSRAIADSAPLNINIEHPLESLRPRHRHMTLGGCFLVLILCNFPAVVPGVT